MSFKLPTKEELSSMINNLSSDDFKKIHDEYTEEVLNLEMKSLNMQLNSYLKFTGSFKNLYRYSSKKDYIKIQTSLSNLNLNADYQDSVNELNRLMKQTDKKLTNTMTIKTNHLQNTNTNNFSQKMKGKAA